MKQNTALKSTAVALVMLFTAANENNAQGNKPSGFIPNAPAKTEVHADSAVTVKSDSVRADFKNNAVDADTVSKKNRVITPDMKAQSKARIYSLNNDEAIGIVVFKGKDMAHYTDEFIAQKLENYCREEGVTAKAFIDSENVEKGNTVYSALVHGRSIGGDEDGILGGKDLYSSNGLPKAISAAKGYRIKRLKAEQQNRASMSLTNE